MPLNKETNPIKKELVIKWIFAVPADHRLKIKEREKID